MLPDTSDVLKMASVGRLYTLRSARRKAAQQLRDKLVPILNNIEAERGAWDVSGIPELLETIKSITDAINEIEAA